LKKKMNTDCSDIDDVIVLRDGNMMVTKVDTKTLWVRILSISLYLTKGQAYHYNLIYRDGKSGPFTKKI
jgi:hypothetical protein